MASPHEECNLVTATIKPSSWGRGRTSRIVRRKDGQKGQTEPFHPNPRRPICTAIHTCKTHAVCNENQKHPLGVQGLSHIIIFMEVGGSEIDKFPYFHVHPSYLSSCTLKIYHDLPPKSHQVLRILRISQLGKDS